MLPAPDGAATVVSQMWPPAWVEGICEAVDLLARGSPAAATVGAVLWVGSLCSCFMLDSQVAGQLEEGDEEPGWGGPSGDRAGAKETGRWEGSRALTSGCHHSTMLGSRTESIFSWSRGPEI